MNTNETNEEWVARIAAALPVEPYYAKDGIIIINSDCRDILPHLPKVDLVLTDPPYGHDNNTDDYSAIRARVSPKVGIANDDSKSASSLVYDVFGMIGALLKPGCCCCCCGGGGGPDPQFARWSLWLDELIGFKQALVWHKGDWGTGWHYRRVYEMVLVAQKPGTCKWFEAESVPNLFRLLKPRAMTGENHPTEKPLELVAKFIRAHSEDGDMVLDPFMGSGTTLVAAKKLNRRAIGIEIEERYVEIAVKRLSQGILTFDDEQRPVEKVQANQLPLCE